MTTKDQRRAAKALMRETGRRINYWDPAGLLAAGAPDDEYDCLVGGLLTQLQRGVAPADLEQWLQSHICDHFGVAPIGANQFAKEMVAWYDNQA